MLFPWKAQLETIRALYEMSWEGHGPQQGQGITWSVGEQAWRQSKAALHSGSFTQAKICGPHFLIMRATVKGPDALRLSKRSTCGACDPPQHQHNNFASR